MLDCVNSLALAYWEGIIKNQNCYVIMSVLEKMLEAGVHFGHPVRRWNPKMAPFIFQEKNGIHILDLVKTLNHIEKARVVLKRSKNVLFVGTRPHVTTAIALAAQKSNSHFVNNRWIGGLLTNWSTMSLCLQKLNKIENQLKEDKNTTGLSKKEIVVLKNQQARLVKFFGGIRNLKGLPDLVVIVGQTYEKNAVQECQKLKIPMISLLDSNCDPTLCDYGIPANDDSSVSVQIILELLSSN